MRSLKPIYAVVRLTGWPGLVSTSLCSCASLMQPAASLDGDTVPSPETTPWGRVHPLQAIYTLSLPRFMCPARNAASQGQDLKVPVPKQSLRSVQRARLKPRDTAWLPPRKTSGRHNQPGSLALTHICPRRSPRQPHTQHWWDAPGTHAQSFAATSWPWTGLGPANPMLSQRSLEI